ncbi:hypothetical protein DPMN_041953 [Dreissena polymorpha]|uniref:Uncharacterized protein n=1 Tax=Dreissena polymorpha TaxID=45954 RepID=A0A9D4CZX2_DREPO|nr:hypothetical protein DPMN_041953 [Dreissena polymorpha]
MRAPFDNGGAPNTPLVRAAVLGTLATASCSLGAEMVCHTSAPKSPCWVLKWSFSLFRETLIPFSLRHKGQTPSIDLFFLS